MNKLELANTLIVVADTGSIQAAADKLHQTSAAISRKITKLESYLEIKLIDRQRTGAVLTDVGQHYYHQCKQALEQFKQAEALVRNSVKEPTGQLTVVTNEFYSTHWILPKLAKFIERFPKIKLSLKIKEILPDFKDKEMDILFGVSSPGSENLARKRIDRFRYLLCASPIYLKKYGQPKTTSELLQHRFIAHSSRNNPDNIILDKEEMIVTKPIILMDHSSTIIAAALKGIGIAWVPDSFVRSEIKHKKLIEILPRCNTKIYDVYIYYQCLKKIDPKINEFICFFTHKNL